MSTPRLPSQSGFTVIELLIVIVVVIAASVLVFTQIDTVRTTGQDQQRKTAINAMHYALEEVYYQQYKSYPSTLKSSTLPSVDPELFTDPHGFTLGKEALSEKELQELSDSGNASDDAIKRLNAINAGKSPNYHYDATDCDTDGNCKGYTLRADMAKEAEYTKKNRSR